MLTPRPPLIEAGSNVTLDMSDPGSVVVSATGGGGTPGGSDTQVQYNNAGAFGGDAGFTFDGTTVNITGALTVGGSSSYNNYISEPGGTVAIGDTEGGGSATMLVVDDGAKSVDSRTPQGACYLGDLAAANTGTYLKVDVVNSRATFNKWFIIDDDTKGVVLKSPDGHYWGVQVNNAGTLTTTDLGTSLP